MKLRKGDTAWVYVTYAGWVHIKIIRDFGNYYTVKRLDKSVAFGVAAHRMLSEEEYRKLEEDEINKGKETFYRPPDLH